MAEGIHIAVRGSVDRIKGIDIIVKLKGTRWMQGSTESTMEAYYTIRTEKLL